MPRVDEEEDLYGEEGMYYESEMEDLASDDLDYNGDPPELSDEDDLDREGAFERGVDPSEAGPSGINEQGLYYSASSHINPLGSVPNENEYFPRPMHPLEYSSNQTPVVNPILPPPSSSTSASLPHLPVHFAPAPHPPPVPFSPVPSSVSRSSLSQRQYRSIPYTVPSLRRVPTASTNLPVPSPNPPAIPNPLPSIPSRPPSQSIIRVRVHTGPSRPVPTPNPLPPPDPPVHPTPARSRASSRPLSRPPPLTHFGSAHPGPSSFQVPSRSRRPLVPTPVASVHNPTPSCSFHQPPPLCPPHPPNLPSPGSRQWQPLIEVDRTRPGLYPLAPPPHYSGEVWFNIP